MHSFVIDFRLNQYKKQKIDAEQKQNDKNKPMRYYAMSHPRQR